MDSLMDFSQVTNSITLPDLSTSVNWFILIYAILLLIPIIYLIIFICCMIWINFKLSDMRRLFAEQNDILKEHNKLIENQNTMIEFENNFKSHKIC